MVVEYRVRLSTIVKACYDNGKLYELTRRIVGKMFRYNDEVIHPVVIIDIVPSTREQRLAGGFLDIFAHPLALVKEPEFIFKNNITREQLTAFFESYEKTLAYYKERGKVISRG